MVQRDADLLALVLEDVNVGHLGARAELEIPVGPHVDEQLHAVRRQLRQRELVLGRVDDHLASRRRWSHRAVVHAIRPECREPVLEHDDLEVVEWYLGAAAWPARAQRAVVGGQECAVVALDRVRDPFVAQHIEAQLRHAIRCAQSARRREGSGRLEARARFWSGRPRASYPHRCAWERPVAGPQDAAERALSRVSTSATSTSTPAPWIDSSSARSERESVIRVCTLAAGTGLHMGSCPIFVWSARTTTCRAAPARGPALAAFSSPACGAFSV